MERQRIIDIYRKKIRAPGLDYAGVTQLSSRGWAGQLTQYPPLRREAPTSITRLDAAGVHRENPRELLDVPHIIRKLKMRRYEGHNSAL